MIQTKTGGTKEVTVDFETVGPYTAKLYVDVDGTESYTSEITVSEADGETFITSMEALGVCYRYDIWRVGTVTFTYETNLLFEAVSGMEIHNYEPIDTEFAVLESSRSVYKKNEARKTGWAPKEKVFNTGFNWLLNYYSNFCRNLKEQIYRVGVDADMAGSSIREVLATVTIKYLVGPDTIISNHPVVVYTNYKSRNEAYRIDIASMNFWVNATAELNGVQSISIGLDSERFPETPSFTGPTAYTNMFIGKIDASTIDRTIMCRVTETLLSFSYELNYLDVNETQPYYTPSPLNVLSRSSMVVFTQDSSNSISLTIPPISFCFGRFS